MNFEVDRYSSAWAHIALCADLTWASDQPDGFIVANQRLWTQHCRVNQVLQDTLDSQCGKNNHNSLSDKRLVGTNSKENGTCNKRSVKDVIPESRLAQFYGTFYYDDVRAPNYGRFPNCVIDIYGLTTVNVGSVLVSVPTSFSSINNSANLENCYTCTNEKSSSHYSSNSCENTDPTECWMLPEVEYWFRKLVDNSDRNLVPRRRRQYKMLVDDDFERWGPIETSEEAVLKAKIQGVRNLWNNTTYGRPRVPSPLPVSRKIRARRRQSRKFGATSPNCILDNAQLHTDSNNKFDASRSPQLSNYQRAIGRLSSSVQAFMRANNSKYLPYKGTFVNRYTPTGPRPARYVEKRLVWWPGKNISPRLDKLNNTINNNTVTKNINNQEISTKIQSQNSKIDVIEIKEEKPLTKSGSETTNKTKKIAEDDQVPTTSNKAKEDIRKKLLYSTVLSMSAPPIITPIVRNPPKLKPGLIKLNPKISAKLRPSIDKFEELEKEALEQYKDSDESIDTKFRELEKQAVEQYSTSNSNTSCSSDNFGEKKSSEDKEKDTDLEDNFNTKKSVDSVVIYSQNFPDLNAKQLSSSNSIHLKNFHSPPRGEKKELRPSKSLRNKKNKPKRPASDTDYESKAVKENHQSLKWTLPKKRHMILCMSDFSSDDDLDSVSVKNHTPLIKNHLPVSKVKISTYGGGDLHPILRKT